MNQSQSTAAIPHIRIFPHSEDEFPSLEFLQTWLLTALKANAGEYLLKSEKSVAELPPGSIVLFRIGDLIVGEAVVQDYKRGEKIPGRTMLGKVSMYSAMVKFSPTSIRLFSPSITLDTLQGFVTQKDMAVARGYYKIDDWSIYPKMLKAHISDGGSFI